MSNTLLWIALAGGELLLIIFIALLVSWIRNRIMRRRDRKAIDALVSNSRGRKEERMAELGDFLGEKYALEGEAHGYAVRALYKAEARLIQAFARTYLNRDARSASRFNRPVEDSVGEYWSLEAGVGHADFVHAADASAEEAMEAAQAAAEGQEMVDSGELAKLRKENETLSDELRLAMDTMGRMLNEYSNVFTKDADLGNIQVIDGEPSLDDFSEALTEAPEEAETMVETSEASGDQPEDASLVEEGAGNDEPGQDDIAATAAGEGDVPLDETPAPEGAAVASGDNVFDQAEAVLNQADRVLREMGMAEADVQPDGNAAAASTLADEEIDDLLDKLDKQS